MPDVSTGIRKRGFLTGKMEKPKVVLIKEHCCIKTCMSTNRSEPKRRFFFIPSIKIGQGQKRQRWISAIKQINGDSWEPKVPKNVNHGDKVCSLHFRSGNHSQSQWDEDYVPHIFINDFKKYAKNVATE